MVGRATLSGLGAWLFKARLDERLRQDLGAEQHEAGALLGVRPCPADEIWLRDSDIVLVPKTTSPNSPDSINSLAILKEGAK